MAVIRLGGPGSVNLPTFPGLVPQTTGSNAGTIAGLTNTITLGPGESFNIPSGTYMLQPGIYTFVQWFDPVTGIWRTKPTGASVNQFVNSDGSNYRLANLTGCAIGALITTGGTATTYTNGIGSAINGCTATVSSTSGASVWQTVVGGAISATLTTGAAGSGYLYPPIVVIDAPPYGGLQATAYVTSLTTGTVPIANITVVNQGAGYTVAPNITFVNDPRDTAGTGAACTVTLTATNQLTGLYPTNNGTPVTAVPTITIGAGNAAATAIMNFTVNSWTQTGAGSSLSYAEVRSVNNTVAVQTLPVVNPLHSTGCVFPRPCRIVANVSGGTATTTGAIYEDAGLGIQQIPGLAAIYAIISATTTGTLPTFTAATVQGISDTSTIQPV